MKSIDLLRKLKELQNYGFSINVGSGVADFIKNEIVINLTLARSSDHEEYTSIVWTDKPTLKKEFNIYFCHDIKAAEIKDNSLIFKAASKTIKIDLMPELVEQ